MGGDREEGWKNIYGYDRKKSSLKDIRKRYCLARWIRPKLGSFKRPLLKREAQRFLEKSARPPSFKKCYFMLHRKKKDYALG